MPIGFPKRWRIPTLASLMLIPSFPGGAPAAAAPDYVALVQTMLSGTSGWATDPADTAINFTDTGGTTPVSNPGVHTVARANSKFGTTTYNWQQATVAAQYLWNGASWQADGVDDIIQTTNSTYTANMSAVSFTLRFLVDDLSVNRMLKSWSTITTTVGRIQLRINTDGSIFLQVRRLDADAANDFTSAAGLVTTGTAYTIQFTIDFAGTGNIVVYLNGVSVLTGTLANAVGNSENTNSSRDRWGLNTGNTLTDWFDGKIGAAVFARSLLSTGDLATCRGFVERNPL